MSDVLLKSGNYYEFLHKKEEPFFLSIYRNKVLVKEISLKSLNSDLNSDTMNPPRNIYIDVVKKDNFDLLFFHFYDSFHYRKHLLWTCCYKDYDKEITIGHEVENIPETTLMEKIVENIKNKKTRFFPLWKQKSNNKKKQLLFIGDEFKVLDFSIENETACYDIEALSKVLLNLEENKVIGIFKDEKIPYILTYSLIKATEESKITVSTPKFHLFYPREINNNVVVKKILTFKNPNIDTLFDFLDGKQNWFSYYFSSGKEQKVWITKGQVTENKETPQISKKKTKRKIATV